MRGYPVVIKKKIYRSGQYVRNVLLLSKMRLPILRLSEAIQVHQKAKQGKRKGRQMGWPKFRSWKRSWFSLFYDEPEKGFKIQGNNLILSLVHSQI